MSGLARAVKKHWKRKVKMFKKYWKIVAIAVVAYFTFGLAVGAMPAAGAATGSVAAGGAAAATGAGVMTTTAAAAGSGAAAAATGAAAAAGIETVTVTAAAAGGFSAGAGAAAAGAAAGGAAASMAGKPTGAPPSQQAVKPAEPAKPTTSMLDKAKGAWKDMSFTDKLLLAKAGVDVVAAASAPSPEEEAAAAAKWQGAFYGKTASEADQFMKQQNQATQVAPATTPGKSREIVPTAEPVLPQKQAAAGPMQTPQRMQFESTAEKPEQQAPPQQAEQVTNVGGNRDLFAQRAPGVRYLV